MRAVSVLLALTSLFVISGAQRRKLIEVPLTRYTLSMDGKVVASFASVDGLGPTRVLAGHKPPPLVLTFKNGQGSAKNFVAWIQHYNLAPAPFPRTFTLKYTPPLNQESTSYTLTKCSPFGLVLGSKAFKSEVSIETLELRPQKVTMVRVPIHP